MKSYDLETYIKLANTAYTAWRKANLDSIRAFTTANPTATAEEITEGTKAAGDEAYRTYQLAAGILAAVYQGGGFTSRVEAQKDADSLGYLDNSGMILFWDWNPA